HSWPGQLVGAQRGQPFLVGGFNGDDRGAVDGRDHRRMGGIGGTVEADAEKPERAADALADDRVVLADAGGEHQQVEAPEYGTKRTDLAHDAMDIQLQGDLRAWIVAFGGEQ